LQKFSQYFNDWLYGQQGYYTKYRPIGKSGDFYTSVSSSMLFGGSIANYLIEQITKNIHPKDISVVEIGAHHGYLLADMIQTIYTLKPRLLKSLKFYVVEKFEHLQQKQKEYFKKSFGDVIDIKVVSYIEQVDSQEAFIVSNEIFDAFETELVYAKNGVLQQAFVNEHDIIFKNCEDSKLKNHCKKYNITKGEVSLSYEAFVKDICQTFKKFEFISFDYGEKYHRNDFSCRIYKNHKVYPIFEDGLNLKELYKKSDITYDVDFRYLKDLFTSYGKETLIIPQNSALVEFGIIKLLAMIQTHSGENAYLKELTKIKTLLEPTSMGERFKMIRVISN
jgi:SAM-dependent MidA family methyltransferase